MVALDRFEQLQAVELAALQPDVQENQMRAPVGNLRQRRIAVARGPCGEPLVLENARNQIADIRLVIDNQNIIRCHGFPLSCQLPVAASIFGWVLVASDGSAGSVLDRVTSSFGASSAFAALPEMAKRSRIQAPRA